MYVALSPFARTTAFGITLPNCQPVFSFSYDRSANRGCSSWTPRTPALMVEAPLSRTTVQLVVGMSCYNVGWPPAFTEQER